MKVPYSYLPRQFEDPSTLLEALRPLVEAGEFTLGERVERFESEFAQLHCGSDGSVPHAIGVGSGTDALALALQAMGIGAGAEVITTPTTFIATAGAIEMVGARPVFVDTDDRYLLDLEQVERAIGPRTQAIVPVHYTGDMLDMARLRELADQHSLTVIEDACQAVLARFDGEPPGRWSDAAAFSLHPLKNLHVWGDGGIVLTRKAEVEKAVRLQRNHGLVSRDEATVFGRNSRLHTLQAAVGSLLIPQAEEDACERARLAAHYDQALAGLEPVLRIPPRHPAARHVFHLYVLQVSGRDDFLRGLQERGVSAKVHYPVPVHLQPAASKLGYRRGDFPNAETYAKSALTLPLNPYLSEAEVAYLLETTRALALEALSKLEPVASRAS